MATTKITCFNDRNYRDNSILAIKDTRMLIGAEYAGENYREYFGLMQFAVPALYDQNITSAKLYLYVLESKTKVTLESQFYDIKEEVKINTYDSFMNNYGDKYVMSGSDEKTFESSSTVYNSWVSLDITNLVVGNNNNPTFSVVLVDNDHNQWASGAGGVPTPYVCHVATIEEGHAPYIVITHENAKPFKPTILYPDGDIVPNSGNVVFRWKYNAGFSKGQVKYDFGWKMQSGIQWTDVSVASSSQQHTMDATKFQNGIAEWRVRTYNGVGMVSDYSSGQFYVVGRPGNPVITGVKNDSLTEIAWAAERAEESSARIKIIKDGKEIYDSGVISGGIEDIHKPNIILPNGVYTAILSIANIYDLWSDQISKSFTINCSRPDVPDLTAQGQGDSVELGFNSNINSFYIYRSEGDDDYIPIAYVNPPFFNRGYTYRDYAVKSDRLYRYFVRAYYEGGISDSRVREVYVKYDGYYISDINNMDRRVKLILSSDSDYIPVTISKENVNARMQYIGRKYPVKEAGTFSTQTLSVVAFVYHNQVRTLEDIMDTNGICCFRGRDMAVFVDITSISLSNAFFDKGSIVTMSMERLEHGEGIDYV